MKYQNIKVKKSLGQNFLIDKNIINKIIKIGSINKNKSILEIGPGSGNLTEKLVKLKVKDIIVVEKDKNLSLLLSKKFYNYNNFQVVNDDILKKIKFFEFKKNFIVYGNLPYNISTQILVLLATLNKWPPWYDSLIFMFQKEVADRILAKKNTNNYGRLAVLCNWRLDIKKHFDISKNCFFPKPKVNSTVLSFTPKRSFNVIEFEELVRKNASPLYFRCGNILAASTCVLATSFTYTKSIIFVPSPIIHICVPFNTDCKKHLSFKPITIDGRNDIA